MEEGQHQVLVRSDIEWYVICDKSEEMRNKES